MYQFDFNSEDGYKFKVIITLDCDGWKYEEFYFKDIESIIKFYNEYNKMYCKFMIRFKDIDDVFDIGYIYKDFLSKRRGGGKFNLYDGIRYKGYTNAPSSEEYRDWLISEYNKFVVNESVQN